VPSRKGAALLASVERDEQRVTAAMAARRRKTLDRLKMPVKRADRLWMWNCTEDTLSFAAVNAQPIVL